MANDQRPVQPRLKDDIGRVLKASAKKNGRNVPQELDQILRDHFFAQRITLGRWWPGAKPGEDHTPTPAEDLGFVMKNGVLWGPEDDHPFRMKWNARKKQYEQPKRKARK
jgi:hypothetical protein